MDKSEIDKAYHDFTILFNPERLPSIPIGEEVVAGEDDRKDVHQLTSSPQDSMYRRLAAATVILTNKSRVSKNNDGSWTLAPEAFRQGGLPPCSGERFANQHTGGWCSGFLVGPDVIVTAGHCGKTEDDILNTAYMFGFRASSASDPGTTEFSADQVYFGKQLIAHDLSSTGDYAIVRVDRKVTAPGADPLTVRASGALAPNSNLGVIGYPSGLPCKIAFGEKTILLRDEDPWLISNLDTYGGNSGSPVFNENGDVEGILVRGAQDYIIGDSCFKTNVVKDANGSEAITKASVFQSQIPK
ncbi:MAG: serine protease [Pseudomonadota bacterium]